MVGFVGSDQHDHPSGAC